LTAVNFQSVKVSSAVFEQFCTAVASRLQVLLFESARAEKEIDPLSHVGLLRELRVLVVDGAPPLPALLQLHRLVYLHVNERPSSYEQDLTCAVALRHLSSSHSLRSLSFGASVNSNWIPESLFLEAAPSETELDGAHSALVDWSQPINLTDLSFADYVRHEVLQQCATIPTLTRLQVCPALAQYGQVDPRRFDVFMRLQELRLLGCDGRMLSHVAKCNRLRVLHIFFVGYSGVTAKALCAVVAANAATLEELRFSCQQGYNSSLGSAFKGGAASGVTQWSVLAQCVRLRVLELPLSGVLTPHLCRALAEAPVFQSLELALPAAPSECRPQVALLPSALASSSWCSVRLFLPSRTSAAALRSLAAGLSKLLPPSSATVEFGQPPSATALHRLRVFVRRMPDSTERCFVLRQTNGGGSFEWQYEY
jgi:hypothetical protein